MGVVSLALVRGPGASSKLVVLKQLHQHLLTDPDSVQMLLDEARVSSRIYHPNVVRVYEATEHGGAPTIVMEYLEGQPLPVLIGPPKGLPLHLHLAVLAQVLRGLDAAHALRGDDGELLGLIHRDMSPHNVFVGYDGQVKVLDFGIAKLQGSDASTKTGVLKGKLRYMSPEQVCGGELDRRCDIFSVGVMLWEALSLRRMWGEASDGQVLRALVNGEIPALDAGGVEPRLARACQRALANDPGQRYATAAEFSRDLQAWVDEQPQSVDGALSDFLTEQFGKQRQEMRARVEACVCRAASPPPPPSVAAAGVLPDPASHEVTQRRARSWLFGGAAVLALGVGVVAFHSVRSQRGPAEPTGADNASSLRCAEGARACKGECVSIERPDYGCGSESCAACAVANATSHCNRNHECEVAVCYRGYGNCDGNSANGCEVSLRTDPKHCGACAEACPELPNAEVGCGDSCRIWRCSPGFEDCNGLPADGCEVNVASDEKSCGSCGKRCPTGRKCEAQQCIR